MKTIKVNYANGLEVDIVKRDGTTPVNVTITRYSMFSRNKQSSQVQLNRYELEDIWKEVQLAADTYDH